MTSNAPEFSTIYPEIKNRLLGHQVVAHNESFDRSVLVRTMQLNQLNDFDLDLDQNGIVP